MMLIRLTPHAPIGSVAPMPRPDFPRTLREFQRPFKRCWASVPTGRRPPTASCMMWSQPDKHDVSFWDVPPPPGADGTAHATSALKDDGSRVVRPTGFRRRHSVNE